MRKFEYVLSRRVFTLTDSIEEHKFLSCELSMENHIISKRKLPVTASFCFRDNRKLHLTHRQSPIYGSFRSAWPLS